jgi:hypothetical protein
MPSGPTAADAVDVADGTAAVLFDVVLLLDPQPAKTPLKPTTHTATTSLGCTNTATDLLPDAAPILSDRIAVRQRLHASSATTADDK